MSDLYRDHLLTPGVVAGWMQAGNGGLFLQTFGFAFDSFAAEDARRMLASLPGFAFPASLREIGKDRGVLLLPEMTPAAQVRTARLWIQAHWDYGLAMGIGTQVQALFEPERPTVRVVWGNSTRANWATVYGTDDVSSIDVGRGAPAGEYWDLRRSTSNWDWWSEYFAQPEVADDEPVRLSSVWVIVYMPASVALLGADVVGNPLQSVGSTMTARAALNISLMARHWAGAHVRLEGWILASDHTSFDPAGSGAGYPDGTWWQTIDEDGNQIRLESARYYLVKNTPGISGA